MKNSVKLRYFIPLSLFLLLVVLTPSVFAVGKPTDVGRNATGVPRLAEAKLKACQAKEKAIKKRAKRLGGLAANMQNKFDSIAARVREYYTTKVVPSGKTVANYDSLVADIQTKKGAVQTALTQVQATADSFACDSNDPKGQLAQFRAEMRAVKSALKDYRTAIKNLIVAVRSVTGATERSNTASPKPTKPGGNE